MPSTFAKSWLSANRQTFDDVIACDLCFGLPRSKILATPINWRSPEKLFWRHFFLEHLRLCPWSLALTSSILVLGLERVCPRKGCPWPRIFLCPWPWPRALCPRLHLCVLAHHRCVINQQLKSLESRIRYSALARANEKRGTSQKWGGSKIC